MSIWRDLTVGFSSLPGADPRIRVEWRGDGFDLEAEVGDVDGQLRVRAFFLQATSASGAIPSTARRLPTDAQVLQLLLDDADGRRLIVWYRDALHQVSSSPGVSPDSSRATIDEAMAAFARRESQPKTTRPPIEDIREEIEWVKEQIPLSSESSDESTSELIARMRDKFFISAPTAYRRLRDARRELEQS